MCCHSQIKHSTIYYSFTPFERNRQSINNTISAVIVLQQCKARKFSLRPSFHPAAKSHRRVLAAGPAIKLLCRHCLFLLLFHRNYTLTYFCLQAVVSSITAAFLKGGGATRTRDLSTLYLSEMVTVAVPTDLRYLSSEWHCYGQVCYLPPGAGLVRSVPYKKTLCI